MKHSKQQGLSALGLLLVLAIAGFFLTIGTRIGPLYLDNSFVNAALQSLENESVHTLTDRQIRRKMSDYFMVNNVRDVKVKDLVIERNKKKTVIRLDYERRINFMANVDVVVVFTNAYDPTAP